ncbi:hypothetical protein FHU38_004812 [Saccharomonospora amisosensis]|uniref:Uncharacterized protein n=1 Tax=Saccharomonospora amisosensis TaxID=1128677 RepID=A0A7X5ZTA6_9PSEU|nr:hypothetical protein [Saccharomonospora amisosensis]
MTKDSALCEEPCPTDASAAVHTAAVTGHR